MSCKLPLVLRTSIPPLTRCEVATQLRHPPTSIATAFTKLVNSLVSDILLPPISLLPWMDRNLDEKFLVLRGGGNATELYNTKAQALADGALIWTYG
jgi:hypothetical protein